MGLCVFLIVVLCDVSVMIDFWVLMSVMNVCVYFCMYVYVDYVVGLGC